MSEQKQYASSIAYWKPGGRASALDVLRSGKAWDLVIVGGGITGAGIYREAVAQGLKTLLIEQKDFAWGTSSRSSKMVHGGLRYLGSGQFGLANDSVKERQNLMDELPGLVEPLPFMMGHYRGVFPGPWIFNKLLAIYDYMAGKRYRQFFKRGILDFLVPGLRTQQLKGVTQFADASTDDARLVLRVLEEGNQDGGIAINYLRAGQVLKNDEGKVSGLLVQDQLNEEQFELHAKVIVNAAGVWTDELRQQLGSNKVIRPLRGSHLVLPQWRLPVAYSVSFFHPKDNRPVFAFPWEGVTVVGTTDLDHSQNSLEESCITSEEVSYLIDAVNQQFPTSQITEQDVTATYSGVRPVVSKHSDEKAADLSKPAKPSDEKREHVVWDNQGMVSVAGGKLTTYRLIALDVLQVSAKYLGKNTEDFKFSTHFRGGDLDTCSQYLNAPQIRRLAGRYGSGLARILALVELQPELADKVMTSDTIFAELVYACETQSVAHLDDLLLRRTRLGLVLPKGGASVMDRIKSVCFDILPWDDIEWQREVDRYLSIIATHYSLPESQDKPSVVTE